MPPLPPLRTVHAPFNAYGSSIEQHPCATAPDDSAVPGRLLRSAVGPWARGQPERYCGSAGSRDDFGGGSSTSKGLADPADRSASLPNAGWLTVHARRHQKEVCPLSRGVMSQPLSGLLPAGLRLLPPPLPAVPSASLASRFPGGETTGLPRSADVPVWVRSRLSAGGSSSAPEEFGAPGPGHVPFGPSDSASCAWP